MAKNEPKGMQPRIVSLGEFKKLFSNSLEIPVYQRPYSWSKESVNTLYEDIVRACKNYQHEYRLGSIILYREGDKYHIVDGQQRLTTLSLFLYSLDSSQFFLNPKFSKLSNNKIIENHLLLNRRVLDLSNDDKSEIERFILKNCSVVLIITDKQQEAFQFFDGQNNRGKELAPHDLLKSYHLREMRDIKPKDKVEIINQWENLDQQELVEFFEDYLFPLTRWYRKERGLDYSVRFIDEFKGINMRSSYNYATYHRASHLFTEQFISNRYKELLGVEEINQFQLTQPILAGQRFFLFTLHYMKLLDQVRKRLNIYHRGKTKEEMPQERKGDKYVLQLYENILLFIADRFGIASLSDEIIRFVYSAAYIIRLRMHAVYKETINNYALGSVSDRLKMKISPIFEFISRSQNPEDLLLIPLEILSLKTPKTISFQEIDEKEIHPEALTKYHAIYERINGRSKQKE